MDPIQELFGSMTGIYTRDIVLEEPFEDFSARFADVPGTVVLLSGGDLDCSRYHILAAKPWLTLSGRRFTTDLSSPEKQLHLGEDPLAVLRKVLKLYHRPSLREDLHGPAKGGLFGYLAYDLKDCIEDLPGTSIDDTGLPLMLLFAPSILVIHDKSRDATRLIIPERSVDGRKTLDEDLGFFNRRSALPRSPADGLSGSGMGLFSNFTRENYIRAIENIIEYIASGHVYQVNMSQRFTADFSGSAYALFTTYYRMNPAPFFAYIHAGDHQIVSTSPERFIFREKDLVETRPIKGTRPRGKTTAEDRRLRNELYQSPKDDAELSMIVDLLRNDMGKVCRRGSVRVAEHRRVEAYANVYHLVSVVKGTLDEHVDSVDLIRATFPGGSITGCPKIRAMEIIDELEPHRRHIYTGAIGYIGFNEIMDLSIAIRTATLLNGKILFSVGGGIVYDSDPEMEFEETLHKGRTLMSVFNRTPDPGTKQPTAWINGGLIPLAEASIPISDPGFQYGFGFFETIRAVDGRPKNLQAHISRFETAWNHLFCDPVPDLSWEEIIRRVLLENGLGHTVAAIKLMATRGTREKPPFDHVLAVTARPYVHRLTGKKEAGIHLSVYPHPRQTPVADHKTLNYLYYFLAGQWARRQGADEALILNPDGTVSETNTAGLLLIRDKTVVLPQSLHVLPGTMQDRACGILSGWGYAIKKLRVFPGDLITCDEILLTNALMGAVPAISLDGRKLAPAQGLWTKINSEVL